MYGKINTYGQRGCQHGEALDSITAMHKYEKVGRPHNLCERIYDLTNKLSSGGDRRCTRQQLFYGAKLRTDATCCCTCDTQCFTMFCFIFLSFLVQVAKGGVFSKYKTTPTWKKENTQERWASSKK